VSYLLDTNVFSEIRKGDEASAEVRRWWRTVEIESIHISVIVIGEIRRGAERIRRRDSRQALVLERWLEQLQATYADRIMSIDVRVADLWGRLQVPNPLPAIDSLLAATAIVHDLVFVTRNVKDVHATGARCLNPFEAPTE
jgi:predicted nucleic acid-binding protein